jgi:hypothetical protein
VVCPDDSAIDHLHSGIAAPLGEGFEHQVPQTTRRPTTVLPMHGVPSPELLGQITPGGAGSGDPEHRIQCPSVVARRTPPQRARLNDEGFEECPLLVGQKPSDQR